MRVYSQARDVAPATGRSGFRFHPVLAGLVPAIHGVGQAWMTGTSPRMILESD